MSLTGSRPNIVMIIVHDLGQYLGCFGAGIKTPNLDALAGDGVVFDNHFCTAAQCSPSRGSIMTGRMPHNNGLIGLAHIGWQVGSQEITLPMYLNAAGYDTHLFGFQHEHSEPQRLGYQHMIPGRNAAEIAGLVGDFLHERGQSGQERPFFINTGWGEPHRPYGQEGYANDDPADVNPLYWLPDRPGIREDIAGLNGLVYAVDEAVGRVREALATSGLADNTLLVFTTDHGLAMPRAKGTCYEPGLKTTFMAHWPGRIEGGARYGEMISNMDLLPTALDLAGVETPKQVEGRSFLPLVTGEQYQPREYIFSEMTWHDQYNPMRAVRTERYKYIRNFGDRPLVFMPYDIWTGPAGKAMKDDYYSTRRPAEELYDLQADPLEQTNLIDDAAHAAVAEDLRQRVADYMHETNDLLLYGDPPPTRAQAERMDAEKWDNG
ncbi:MAG: sulfatase family protein [Armatimonadota bacterium]